MNVIDLIDYLDDIVVAGDDLFEMNHPKVFLGNVFKIKDLGLPRYFLRIEVVKSKDGIFLSQCKYMLNLL